MNADENALEPVLSTRELLQIFWRFRLVLVVSAIVGIVWAVLVYPPGMLNIRTTVDIRVSNIPVTRLVGDLDWWSVVLSKAQLPASLEDDKSYTMTVTQEERAVSVVLASTGHAAESHSQIVDMLRSGLGSAEEAFIASVQDELDLLKSIQVTPDALPLVVQDAFELEGFLKAARAVPGRLFTLQASSSEVTPITAPGTYVRFVLVALAGGIVVIVGLYLLDAWWRRRIPGPSPQ